MRYSRHEINVDFSFPPGQEVTIQKLHGDESVPTSRLSASQEALKFS